MPTLPIAGITMLRFREVSPCGQGKSDFGQRKTRRAYEKLCQTMELSYSQPWSAKCVCKFGVKTE